MTRCRHKLSPQRSLVRVRRWNRGCVGLRDLMEEIKLSKEIKTVLAVRKWKRVKKKESEPCFSFLLCFYFNWTYFRSYTKRLWYGSVLNFRYCVNFKYLVCANWMCSIFPPMQLGSSIVFIYQIYLYEPKSTNSFKSISSSTWKCLFIIKLLLYRLYLFLYLHEAGQVTYFFQKQWYTPWNGYKFRNGNDLFLLSACNPQPFSREPETALERQFVCTGS